MFRNGSAVPAVVASCVLAASLVLPSACSKDRPRVVRLELESVSPVDEAVADYTFRVVVKNPLTGDIHDVVATASLRDGATTVILDGESILEDIPARSTVTSKDTVTVRHEGKDAYDGSDLKWQVVYGGGGPPPNQPPIAGAGWMQTVQAGDLVQLDGRSSSDPEGDPLTFLWSFVSMPTGSNAQLVAWDTAQPTFVPDLAGTYQVQLVVNDGQLDSAPSWVWITVLPLDPNPPSISSVYPVPDATYVPTNAFISAQFSEWLDAATVNASSFTLVGPGGPVAASNVRASGAVALFYPQAPLAADTTYLATLSGTILDRQGQPLGADFVWAFSTGYEVDLVPPTVYSVAPPDGATGIVPTDPGAIEVEFDDTIDPTSLAGRITVSVSGGAAVNGSIQPVGGNRARFVPQLAQGQTFENQTWVATVWPGILDTSGNALQQATTWSFQTRPSHSPAWLSRPAGVGSPAETAAYYANLPIKNQCTWDWTWETWECAGRGAPPGFWNFLWDLGWHPTGEPRAVFYNANDLAVGRDAHCFFSGTPAQPPGAPSFGDPGSNSPNQRGGGLQVGCYVLNHGPIPGNPDHPDPNAALSEAVSQTAPFSISAIFSRYDRPGSTRTEGVTEQYLYGGYTEVEVGDVVTVGPATGSIWAGNAFYGSNGPDGIIGQTCVTTIFDPGPCPLEGGPLYGLLISTDQVKLSNGSVASGLRALGTSVVQFKALERGSVAFYINDHEAGNGNGQFDVPVSITRANGVSFMVYVPNGTGAFQLSQTATLDDEGPKQVPQACIACHGGTWDPDTQTVTGASLLPFDIGRVELPTATGFTRTDQEEPFRMLNWMVQITQGNRTDPTSPIVEWIDGTYANRVNYSGQTANDSFVPPGWSGDSALYRDVAKPYCLSCHSSFRDAVDFDTAGEFRSFGASIQSDVCNGRSMPHAGPTFEAFWQSGAADILSQALFGGAHCGP